MLNALCPNPAFTALNRRIFSSRTMCLEVPTDECVNLRQCGQGNVGHVRPKLGRQDSPFRVRCHQRNDLRRHGEHFAGEQQHLLMQVPNGYGCVLYLGGCHIPQHRNQPSRPKVANETIGPHCELGVEAPTPHRRIDVDPKSIHFEPECSHRSPRPIPARGDAQRPTGRAHRARTLQPGGSIPHPPAVRPTGCRPVGLTAQALNRERPR